MGQRPISLLNQLGPPNEPVPMMAESMLIEFPETGIRLEGSVTIEYAWRPGVGPLLTVQLAPSREQIRTLRSPKTATVLVNGSSVDCAICSFRSNRLHSDALERRGLTAHRAAPHDAGDVQGSEGIRRSRPSARGA